HSVNSKIDFLNHSFGDDARIVGASRGHSKVVGTAHVGFNNKIRPSHTSIHNSVSDNFGKRRGAHNLDSDFPPLKPSNHGFDHNTFPSVWSKPKTKLHKLLKKDVGNDSNGMFVIPEAIIDVGEKLWEFAFVGHIIDKNLPFSLVHDWARRTWGDVLLETIKLEPSFFLFKVGNESALNDI
ncbi:hypothetical protein, partial [Modestobacter marinus]|uniref:hypothetical protein n=1 Tax=Modestobacter marinus TaxID=477641 RepID=UPI001C978CE8